MRWWEELQGPLLGRYRVEKLLGQGGMAEVLLARDERFEGKRVAIKAPTLDSFAPNQLAELLLRFRREVQRQGSESIAGVVPIFDAGEVTDSRGNSQPFLVMDYLSGGSLGDALGGSSGRRERTQTLGEVLEWLKPVATTLDRLHSRKYLHRDVKPDNILFNADGDPFLSDFGIATSLDDVAGAGTMMSVMGSAGPGSPGYQSPESLRGEKLAASDQFSLAATAYEALAGRLPMNATTRDGWIGALANWKPTPLSELCPQLPTAATDVLMRALSVEPRSRFLSCSAFAQALTEATSAPARVAAPEIAPAPPPAIAPSPAAANPVSEARGSRWRTKSFVAALVLVGLTAGAILIGKWLDQPAIATGDDPRPPALTDGTDANATAPADSEPDDASSFGPEADARRLAQIALATQKLEQEFNLARDLAEVDADNAGFRVSGDASRVKAMQSSLDAANKARQAVKSATRLASLTSTYLDLHDERGRGLLGYALDIARRGLEYSRTPPYVAHQLNRFPPDLPLDASFSDLAEEASTLTGKIEAEIARRQAGAAKPAAAGPESVNDFRRRISSGKDFILRFTDVQASGTSPMARAEQCRALVRLAGLGEPAESSLRSTLGSECPDSGRVISRVERFQLKSAVEMDRLTMVASTTEFSCKREDGSACPGFAAGASPAERGELELVTDDLLLVTVGDFHYLMTRITADAAP